MCRFIETIKIENGKPQNLFYHQQRLSQTFAAFFDIKKCLDLAELLSMQKYAIDKILKCRIVYSSNAHEIHIEDYRKKEVKSIKLIESHSINYDYKFEDRRELNALLNNADCDEIIITKNGMLTDTSYSNLVFENQNILLTPANPLLKGTKRQKLIDNKIILEKRIWLNDIKYFDSFYLINSMLDLEESNKLPINIIQY